MGIIFSKLPALPISKSRLALALALGLTLYNRYQSKKYRNAVERRKLENRSREQAKSRKLYLYNLNLPGAPLKTLINGGPETPLLAFTDSLGLQVAAYHWPSSNGDTNAPCVMLCHGLDVNVESEFCIRPGHHWKGSWQKALCDAGFNVYGWDHHSMGRTESIMTSNHRTVCYEFDDYVDVLFQFRNIVTARHPQSKIFLHGQSLGGCIAVRAAERHPSMFAGVSLACPAVYLQKLKDKPINKILLPLLDILKVILPWLPVGAKQPHPRQDVAAEAIKIGPPMFMGERPIPASLAGTTLPAADLALADTLKMKELPIHIMHAPGDPFVDYRGSVIMYDKLVKAGARDVTLHNTFEEEEHDIVQLKDGAKCAGMLVKWLIARC
jgi:alpha-beta hydrolase superfamily lysophospholipase